MITFVEVMAWTLAGILGLGAVVGLVVVISMFLDPISWFGDR